MTSRAGLLQESEAKIEAFRTHLTADTNVASSTHNQAMNALVFLYKKVLKQPLSEAINATQAAKPGSTTQPLHRAGIRDKRGRYPG